MEQDDTATPSPKNKENNPLESRLTSRSKATSGVVHETASLHRRSEASGSPSGKNTISHAIKSLLPHTTVPALGKRSKDNPRSPLPPTFQGQAPSTTPALASMSEDQLMEAHMQSNHGSEIDDVNVKNFSRNSRGRRGAKATSKAGNPRGYIASVSRKQRGVIIARKAGSRAKDSFMLKNAVCNSSNEDHETAEWISEDDTGLFRMPGRSISTVKIKTYLEAETSLLHLDLRTAIPLKSESSGVETRGSNEKSQRDRDEDALAGPDTETQEPGKTTKSLDASNSSGAEGSSQDREASDKDKDADIPLETYFPGPDDDCRPPAYVVADAQYWGELFQISRGARVEDVAASKAASGLIQIPPHNGSASIQVTRTHSEPMIHLASPESSARQGGASKTMPRESNAHVGEGFRRMKLRKKAERPSSFYRAPEIQERGRTLERDSGQEDLGLGIGLGISMADEESIPEKADSEWQGEEMADDPKIQNYSTRQPSLLIRRKTETAEAAVLPRADDPVVAIQHMLLGGGALVRTGREEDEGLMCVSVDEVRRIRDGRRREREEKEEHQQELDQFVANFEQSQHQEQLASEKPQEGQILDRDPPAKETEFESVPNTDGAQESSQTQSSHRRDRSSSVGSNTSSRTAFRTRDANTTPRPGDIGINNTLGKSQSSVARPLPPPPTFPPDLLDPSHPDDHEDFVSLNDPSIRHHLARALSNIYSGDMAAQNPAMANPAAPYTLGGGMPSAGHHSDMQHIWSLVQELSSVLQQNREQYDELQDGLARAQPRPTANGVLTNGDANVSHTPHASSDVDTTALQAQLSDALSRITELETECKEANQVIDYAEEIVEKFKLQVREYAHSHQSATIGKAFSSFTQGLPLTHTLALHAHYNSLLETSRNETIQAQLTHQAWQASLLRLSENLRLAQSAHEEGTLPYRRRIAALKEENRILRAKAGWEPASDSENSDDEDDVFDEGIEAGSS
ncbi:hypothetical protein E4T50_01589 [Aureobasidium sp. EXF-12298]|nr:hypothetical protein E4T50_01589 [Aureobasidium sp. EXF-12298]KAI4756036.1 hypothetical protein E4T51_10880 [Aureobasidium sp. EXF-12344]KAI4780118.1 hypothetical protein E4T52_05011 [Aureobasidium sp. EXF-3400]